MTNIELNKFTTAMAESDMAERLKTLWGDAERWDVASTGCVANITPIFGYLWLMVAATRHNDKTSEKPMFVTKLPSKGGSCGTVDILESGGFSFPTDPQAIAQQCTQNPTEHPGVICQPTDDLAPIDKVLMDARRATNLITNFPLVYASILSKRIAIGCTHCIVDVKIGLDTKMLSPCMDEKLLKLVRTNFVQGDRQKLVIDDENNTLTNFQYILSQMLADSTTLKLLKDPPYIKQECQNNLSLKKKDQDSQGKSKEDQDSQGKYLETVYWLLTNSSMPQCRAIGRQLILIHIDELIDKAPGTDDLLTRQDDNEYKNLYAKVLPEICGVSDRSWEELRNQWDNLKKKLPKLKSFAVANFLKEDKYSDLEKSYGEEGKDLEIISFGLYPYQLQANNLVKIKQMNAYELDKLFEWLCGDDTYDPEVGIWLHKLPGENVKVPRKNNEKGDKPEDCTKDYKWLESTKQWQEPIISIFYRPSRCPKSEVIARIRRFLCQEIQVN